jgi:hypothetical protein
MRGPVPVLVHSVPPATDDAPYHSPDGCRPPRVEDPVEGDLPDVVDGEASTNNSKKDDETASLG